MSECAKYDTAFSCISIKRSARRRLPGGGSEFELSDDFLNGQKAMQKRQEVLKRLTARSLGKISSGSLRQLYRSVGSPLPEPPLSKAHGVLQSQFAIGRTYPGFTDESESRAARGPFERSLIMPSQHHEG
jgi:hypothetical protein